MLAIVMNQQRKRELYVFSLLHAFQRNPFVEPKYNCNIISATTATMGLEASVWWVNSSSSLGCCDFLWCWMLCSFDFQECFLLELKLLLLQYDETEARRERAKNSLERYMHYYERWASNQTVRSSTLVRCT